MTDIQWLVSEIQGRAWPWTLDGTDSLASALQCRLLEDRAARRTYEVPEGSTMSVYHDGWVVEFIEVTLDVVLNPHLLSLADYEETKDRFFQKFEDTVAEATKVLGPPVFNDGAASDEFPPDQDAEWLAMWNHPCGRVMVELKHEDKELPLRLVIVLTPPA